MRLIFTLPTIHSGKWIFKAIDIASLSLGTLACMSHHFGHNFFILWRLLIIIHLYLLSESIEMYVEMGSELILAG